MPASPVLHYLLELAESHVHCVGEAIYIPIVILVPVFNHVVVVEIETKKQQKKTNENKRWFFEKINTIDKALAELIKEKRENAQINKIRKRS